MLSVSGLHLRAALFRSIRSFFHDQGFLEVDTPVRYPVVLPERHIIPVRSESWFLQSSPEQCMKRLLARGCRAIFQICPCFRGGERGRLHLPEFTMLEWYRTGSDYYQLMDDCEALFRHVLSDISGQQRLLDFVAESGLKDLNLSAPWQRLTVREAFHRYCPEPVEEALAGGRFDQSIVEMIEPRLGYETPCFLVDYPATCASLAQLKSSDTSVAERFELYIRGLELANGFTELTDAEEQRRRFVHDLATDRPDDSQSVRLPERFLADLPMIGSAAGIALGIDRLMMVLIGADTIDAAVSFTPESLG